MTRVRRILAVTFLSLLLALTALAVSLSDAHAQSCTWQVINPPDPAPSQSALQGVASLSSNDVWAFGFAATNPTLQIQHYNGSQWSLVSAPALPSSAAFESMSALSSNSIWAAGIQESASIGAVALVAHWDGSQWSPVPTPADAYNSQLFSVVALGKNDVWVAGLISTAPFVQQSLTEHYDGKAWKMYFLSYGTSLTSIAGTSPDGVWAGGIGVNLPGALMFGWQPNTHQWVQYPNKVGNFIQTMSAKSSREVWAVGPTGGYPGPVFVEKWNGQGWAQVRYPRKNVNSHVHQVEATAPGNAVWFAGGTNSSTHATAFIDRYDGINFTDMHVSNVGSVATSLSGVSPIPKTPSVWAVGGYSDYEGTAHNLAERYTCQ